jgi:hypothetical protein
MFPASPDHVYDESPQYCNPADLRTGHAKQATQDVETYSRLSSVSESRTGRISHPQEENNYSQLSERPGGQVGGKVRLLYSIT